MELKPYLLTLSKEGRQKFADKCHTSVAHLQNCAYKTRLPSAELAVAIELHSKRAVTRQELFPDTFKKTWPELKAA